jgi:hypothetical protein
MEVEAGNLLRPVKHIGRRSDAGAKPIIARGLMGFAQAHHSASGRGCSLKRLRPTDLNTGYRVAIRRPHTDIIIGVNHRNSGLSSRDR